MPYKRRPPTIDLCTRRVRPARFECAVNDKLPPILVHITDHINKANGRISINIAIVKYGEGEIKRTYQIVGCKSFSNEIS